MMKFIIKVLEFYFKCYGYYKLDSKLFDYPSFKHLCLKNTDFQKIDLGEEHYELFEKKKLNQEYLKIIKNRLRVNSGFIGFAYIHKPTNDLAYYCWINVSPSYFVKELNKRYTYGKNNALFEDDQAFEPFLRLGLHQSMMIKRIMHCKENGIEYIYIVIQCKNTPALNTLKKINFKRINLIPIYYRKGSLGYTVSKVKKVFKF